MITATKGLSTERMSQVAMSKDNKYHLLYFPFHGAVTGLRAMIVMSGAEYSFIHPEVKDYLVIINHVMIL